MYYYIVIIGITLISIASIIWYTYNQRIEIKKIKTRNKDNQFNALFSDVCRVKNNAWMLIESIHRMYKELPDRIKTFITAADNRIVINVNIEDNDLIKNLKIKAMKSFSDKDGRKYAYLEGINGNMKLSQIGESTSNYENIYNKFLTENELISDNRIYFIDKNRAC